MPRGRGTGKQFLTEGTVTFRFKRLASASDVRAAELKIQNALAKEPVKFIDKAFMGVGDLTMVSVEAETTEA